MRKPASSGAHRAATAATMAACDSLPVEYATEKWGHRPHYRGAVWPLGDDEHGTWVWGPAGRSIYRGDEATRTRELVEAAERATARAYEHVLANVAPFDGVAAQSWMEVGATTVTGP